MIFTADPGVNTGVALFDPLTTRLVACGLVRFDGFRVVAGFWPWPSQGQLLTVVIVEIPQVYSAAQQKGRQKDVVATAVRGGIIIGDVMAKMPRALGCVLKTPTPHEWKGNVDKAIHNNRVLARLDEQERAFLPTTRTSALHNVLDACGLGLKHLGRM